MAERIGFELNGETRTIEVAPDTPLLYVLRNELGLSNPHFGCGLAQCGACTVHVDGAPTRSCSLPVSAAVGTKVTTLAGLGTPEHPHVHRGHSLDISNGHDALVDVFAAKQMTFTGTRGELRERLAQLEARGATGIIFGTSGYDVERELRAYAEVAGLR